MGEADQSLLSMLSHTEEQEVTQCNPGWVNLEQSKETFLYTAYSQPVKCTTLEGSGFRKGLNKVTTDVWQFSEVSDVVLQGVR